MSILLADVSSGQGTIPALLAHSILSPMAGVIGQYTRLALAKNAQAALVVTSSYGRAKLGHYADTN
jgi:hypothetical protein